MAKSKHGKIETGRYFTWNDANTLPNVYRVDDYKVFIQLAKIHDGRWKAEKQFSAESRIYVHYWCKVWNEDNSYIVKQSENTELFCIVKTDGTIEEVI